MRPLLIVGAGGFARETVEAIRAINAIEPTWRLLGLLDDDPGRHGNVVAGVPVIGPLELVHSEPRASVVLTTGRPDNYVSPTPPSSTRPPRSGARARSAAARCCWRTPTSPPTSSSGVTSW